MLVKDIKKDFYEVIQNQVLCHCLAQRPEVFRGKFGVQSDRSVEKDSSRG